MSSSSSLRSPLARVRGLGSAKHGSQHWLMQRLTALALLPLTVWFVIALLSMRHAEYQSVVNWVGQPLNSALLILLLISLFYHAILGMQVVIEDYIHTESIKITLLILMRFGLILLAAVAVISVIRIVFLSLLPTVGG